MSDNEKKTDADTSEKLELEQEAVSEEQSVEDTFKPADMSGEVPDPIFDDSRPIKHSEFMPDPIFEDEKPKGERKERLSTSELGELASSIPENMKGQMPPTSENKDYSAPTATKNQHENSDTFPIPEEFGDPVFPKDSHSTVKDDLIDIPLIIEDDPEIEMRRKEREKNHSPDVFVPRGKEKDEKSQDKLTPSEEEILAAKAKEEYSYDAMDAFDDDETEIETDNLKKGEDSLLSEKDPTLRKVTVGCGWDMDAFDGEPLDLDLSCFLLNKDNMTRVDSDFVFYNNPKGADLAVIHSGDNRTGAGEGDDETITIDLDALPYEISKIVFTVTIYNGEELSLSFGGVKNAYIRLLNHRSKAVLARFDLSNDYPEGTAIRFGYMERVGNSWSFHAEGEIETGGLAKIAESYGLMIAGT